jgi:molybdate-binding protein
LTVRSLADAPADPRDLLHADVRIAVGPPGTPARHVLDDRLNTIGSFPGEVIEVRSDAVALATVVAGYADCAVTTIPAARHGGYAAAELGQAAMDLAIRGDVAQRDSAAEAFLDTVQSASFAAALVDAGYRPCVARGADSLLT